MGSRLQIGVLYRPKIFWFAVTRFLAVELLPAVMKKYRTLLLHRTERVLPLRKADGSTMPFC
jgi:hypothetical protein